MHRGAAPVKTNSGNNFLEDTENSQELSTKTVVNLGESSALQYCAGNFQGSEWEAHPSDSCLHVKTKRVVKNRQHATHAW